ncbi:MAG: hypothetical protein LBT31_01385, partial [Synergistaceae bacterium]|nr:hypothetical protein [Synergistaceae bacterium]
YGTYKALPGDNVVSVGIPATDSEAGVWKYVVEEVHGFDGNRVVLFALLDDLHDVYDEDWDGVIGGGNNDPYDIIVRGSKEMNNGARGAVSWAGNYPRGVIAGTLHHQLGDGRESVALSDQSIKEISFGPFVRPQDVTVSHIDDDLVLAVRGTTDRVTVPGWFRTSEALNVDFRHDKTQWSATDINMKAEVREPEINYHVVSIDQRIEGTTGDDSLSGGGGNKLFLPGAGNDTVAFGNGGNTLYYRMGEGDDVITGNGGEGSHRGIRFHTDITSLDISAARTGNDMKISVGNGSITVRGWYDSPANRIDVLEFWDDGVWDARNIEYLANGEVITSREVYTTFDERLTAANPGNKDDTSGSSGGSGGCDTSGPLAIIGMAAIAFGVAKARKSHRGIFTLLLALASIVTLLAVFTPAYAATSLIQQEYSDLCGYSDITNFTMDGGGNLYVVKDKSTLS